MKSVKIGGNDCFHNEKVSGDAIFDVIIYHSGVLTERKESEKLEKKNNLIQNDRYNEIKVDLACK